MKSILSVLSTFAVLSISLPQPNYAQVVPAGGARFIRVELPGDKRILTLAEVEVLSGGKNIAVGRKATQSSTNAGGRSLLFRKVSIEMFVCEH